MTLAMALLLATLLGSLAFFEPCTVAVHALYMERSSRSGSRGCWRASLTVWVVRILLVTLPLLLAIELLPPLSISRDQAALVLTLMGILYLFSRQHYIPVPHLAFHRLIPAGSRLPQGVRLGLTLPACTLPLYVVLLGVVLIYHSQMAALLAGFLFATAFTLPMLLVALHGMRAGGSRLLARAAVVTPYVTAGLLFLAALWFVWPSLVSSAGNLEGALEQASWAGLGLSFIAGLVFSFNPVSFAAIPVVLAYVTRAQDEKRALWLGGAFVGGLLVTHVLLGVASALGGEWVQQLLGRCWGAVLGPVLILLGLMWAGVLKLRLPWFSMRAKKVNGAGGAFLLAVPFSVAICPFCAPALLVVITASAAIGSVAYGAALLLAFALGRSIPILLGAWSIGWLESLGPLARHHRLFEVLGGIVLVLAGLYLMNSYFFWIDLGGMS